MNPYQYSPLREDRSEFRLVRLRPGQRASDEIEIEIFHAARSAKYEALSYAWGAPERTEVAIVREQPMVTKPVKPLSKLAEHFRRSSRKGASSPSTTIGITHNLAIALRHLRYKDKPRVLWIDALCINQDDVLERSVEVLDMGSIYSSAKQVVVWIGPNSEDSNLAITTLRKIGKGVFFTKDDHVASKSYSWARSLGNDFNALKSKERNWFAIKDLLRREWFSRLWVLQEVALATSATIYVGQHSINWKLFTFALEWLWTELAQLNQVIPNLRITDFADSAILASITISRNTRCGQNLPLVEFLDITTKLACSDLRDHLYAIRDLLPPSDRELIVPDYSKSIERAFQDVFLRACNAKWSGELLTLCLIQDTPSKLQLPSWVPDFSASNRPVRILGYYATGKSSFYSVVTDETLTVLAVKVATITELSTPLQSSYTSQEILNACRSWESLCTSGIYPGGGSTSDAFVDAILFGERAEVIPDSNIFHLSSRQCRKILEALGNDLEDNERNEIEAYFVRQVRLRARGRAFFRTREGFFGFCPKSANSRDNVVVVLGVPLPLVIRPVHDSGRSCYRVIGPCYMPGAMDAEPLLGQFPVGWNVSYRKTQGVERLVFNQADTNTQKDPRVPLPPPWRYRYGSFEEPQETEPTRVKDFLPQFYENVETKEKTDFDPRLTPEALRDRGIDIQEIVLV